MSDARSTSPALVNADDKAAEKAVDYETAFAPPDADADADDQADGEEENLGDLGGELDDGNDDDPCKFIEKSLYYQDMLMSKRHAEERVVFFKEFAKSMPSSKDPHRRIKQYEARVDMQNKRIVKFRAKYADKRKATAAKRAERIARDKKEREQEQVLGKDALAAIHKDVRKKQAMAMKAAIAAATGLAEGATKEEKEAAIAAAYQKAMEGSTASIFTVPVKEVKERPAKKQKKDKEATEATEAAAVPVA